MSCHVMSSCAFRWVVLVLKSGGPLINKSTKLLARIPWAGKIRTSRSSLKKTHTHKGMASSCLIQSRPPSSALFWLAGFPYKHRLQKKWHAYSNLSTGGPSSGCKPYLNDSFSKEIRNRRQALYTPTHIHAYKHTHMHACKHTHMHT